MALKAGYKGIKKIGTGLKLTTEGTLSLSGSGPTGEIELNDLDDVAITEPANGNILVYDSTDAEWKNAAPTADTNKADISAIGTNETGATASKAYAVGEHFYKNGKFCTAKAAIAQGATFTLGTNYVEGTVAEKLKEVFASLNSAATSYGKVEVLKGGAYYNDTDVFIDVTMKLKTGVTIPANGSLSLISNESGGSIPFPLPSKISNVDIKIPAICSVITSNAYKAEPGLLSTYYNGNAWYILVYNTSSQAYTEGTVVQFIAKYKI